MSDTITVEQTNGSYEVRDNGTVLDTFSSGSAALQYGFDELNDGGHLTAIGDYTISSTGDRIEVSKSFEMDAYDCTLYSQANTHAMRIEGSIQTTHSLSSNVSGGSTSFDVTSTSGISPGGIVAIREDSSAMGITDQGELHRVTNVSGSTVTVEDEIYFDYLTGNNGRVDVFNTHTPIINGLTIEGTDMDGDDRGLLFRFTDGGELRDYTATNCGHNATEVRETYGLWIHQPTIHGSRQSGSGYPVMLATGATKCTVEYGEIGQQSRHGVSLMGTRDYVNRENVIQHNELFCDTGTAMVFRADLHSECYGNYIDARDTYASGIRSAAYGSHVENNYVRGGDAAAVGDRSQGSTVEDMTIIDNVLVQTQGDPGNFAILFRDLPSGHVTIRDNELYGHWENRAIQMWDNPRERVDIEDNYIAHVDTGFDGAMLFARDFDEVNVHNNEVYNHGSLFNVDSFGSGGESGNTLGSDSNVTIPEPHVPEDPDGEVVRTSYGTYFRPNPNTDGDDIRIGSIEVHDEHPFEQE